MPTPNELRALTDAMVADPQLAEDVRKERNKLAGELALNESAGRELISGSGGGTSYTVQLTMTKRQRLAFLQSALDWYDAGRVPMSTAVVQF